MVSERTRAGILRWVPVFLGAAAVRVAYWVLVTPHWVPDADADQYVRLARSLADGRGFGLVYPQMFHHPTAFRPPLYPLLLTPGAWLFGDALWPARVLTLLIGSAVVVLAGVLAARIGGRRAGLVAAALVAVYPPILANDTVTLTEALALALLLAAVLLADADRPIAAGLASGALLLTRPNGYVVVAILAVWCWRKLDFRRAVILGLAALAVLVPWSVRNQIQVGTWRPTTSDGLTLAGIYADPAQREGTFVDPAFTENPFYDDAEHRLARFDEPTWSRGLTEDAIDGLRDDPGYVGVVIRRNFRGFFELSPDLNVYPEENDGRNMDFRDATRPLFYVISLIGLIGLARSWRNPRVIVLAAVVGQFVVLSLVLVAPPRLRAPFDVACCIGVGLLVAEVTARVRGERSGGVLPPVADDSPSGREARVGPVG